MRCANNICVDDFFDKCSSYLVTADTARQVAGLACWFKALIRKQETNLWASGKMCLRRLNGLASYLCCSSASGEVGENVDCLLVSP